MNDKIYMNKQLKTRTQEINYKVTMISDNERALRLELENLAKEKNTLLDELKNLGEEL